MLPPSHFERVRRWLPDADLSAVRANTEGLVNDVFIIDERWVLRVPKPTAGARAALERERRVLELVAPRLSLPVTRFEHCEPDGALYRLLPGVALRRGVLLREPERIQTRVAEQLGDFLRQLHGVPTVALTAAKVGYSETARERPAWLKLLADVRAELFPLMMRHHRDWTEELFAPLLADEGFTEHVPTLIHGDLGPYHLLFSPEQGSLSGVLDFGSAGLGDPAVDWAALLYNLGESFVVRVSPFCGPAGDARLLSRARFWAGTIELQWLLAGVRSKDFSWFMLHLGSARDIL